LAYTLGPLIVALILNTTGVYTNRWAYRAIFCAQYGFAVTASIGVFFMPEYVASHLLQSTPHSDLNRSPWWLISKSRNEAALTALCKLGFTGSEAHWKLTQITNTLEKVKKETACVTYAECFRASNLRRTLMSVAPLCIQCLSGIIFAASYSTYYMQLAGFSTSMSFKLQIVQQVISLLGNVMSWYLIDRVGRRNLTLWGLAVLTIILFLMAALATVGTPAGLRGAVSMILIYCFWYNVTIGATGYTILTEVSTSRLRIKTISIGLVLQNALNTMWSFTLPYLFNPDKLNLGGRLGFVFGGLSVVCLIYRRFCLPETRGRTYEELDDMFRERISARRFGENRTKVHVPGHKSKERRESI
jgi:SP family general alpha glucoside:H+ symporter-like MFS transporter